MTARKVPEPLSVEDVRALIRSCGKGPCGIRNRALISVLWRGGLRCGEALSLCPRDLDLDAGTIHVRRGKNGSDRFVVVDGECLGYLAHWLSIRSSLGVNGWEPVFCTVAQGGLRRAGKPLDGSYVRRLTYRLRDHSGLEKRVHPHGLRHTHACELVAAGVPLSDIRDQLGHRNASTTDIYLRRIAPRDRIKRLRSAGWTLER